MLNDRIKILWNNFIYKVGRGQRFTFKLHLIELLKKHHPEKSEFIFIQIGANDGVNHDYLYDFVIERNSKGLVVEPLSDYFLKLQFNYKDYPEIIKCNYAIHPTDKEVTLYRINPKYIKELPDWVSGIASLNSEHYKKLNIDESFIKKENVKAKTFAELINECFRYNRIDLLQIDTEGFDFEILKMIDLEKITPNFIKYEHCNLSFEDYHSSLKLLKINGYLIFKEGNDTIGVRKRYDS